MNLRWTREYQCRCCTDLCNKQYTTLFFLKLFFLGLIPSANAALRSKPVSLHDGIDNDIATYAFEAGRQDFPWVGWIDKLRGVGLQVVSI